MGQNYPSWRYHKVHGSRKVNDPSHEEEVAPYADGWRESPAELVDVPVVDPPPVVDAPVVTEEKAPEQPPIVDAPVADVQAPVESAPPASKPSKKK